MEPDLRLAGVLPAARALVLARLDRTGARDAADRRISRGMQGIDGHLVHVAVRVDALCVPVDDRLDLPDAVAFRPFDLRRVGAGERLLATDARDPGVVRLEGALERLDLADVAAAVGIALPEVRPLELVLLRDGHHPRADQVQAVALDERVSGRVGLREEE